MCTATVTYDRRNKLAMRAMELMSTIKGVKINYESKKKTKMNGLDEAIEDIKMGRVEVFENFDEFKKSVYKELGYVQN